MQDPRLEELAARLKALEAENARLSKQLDYMVEERTAELAASENRYRELAAQLNATLNALPDLFFEVDAEGVIYNYHAPHPELLYAPPESFLGKKVVDVLPPESAAVTLQAIQRADANGRDTGAIYPLPIGAETNWFEISVAVRESPAGSPRRFVALVRDITRRKHAQEALRQFNESLEQRVQERTAALEAANQEMEAFTYSVSHDLRAPLRAMDGYARMMQQDHADCLDEESRYFLDQIRSGADKMGQLIDDLLNLSRVSRREMAFQPVDLSGMAAQIMLELRSAQPERALEFQATPGCNVTGDPGLLHIMLHNLLENAWKFTRNCPLSKIEFGCQEQDGKTVYLVRDNGVGFDMVYQNKLFGVFQRLHHESEFPGTGIGLVLVKRIIQRHGGEIWVEAAKDQGACFYFRLPPT